MAPFRISQRYMVLACIAGFALCACLTAAETEPHNRRAISRLDITSLPNAYRVNDKVISGGQPAGKDGFAALKQLGVQTIISVDGAKPDVALAKQSGLRYVHLPHGYDGIAPQRAVELAKAVSELPTPIYIHCHHGKHRAPAAAAVACIGVGLMTPDEGADVLKLAGTGPSYRGLYAVVAATQRNDDLDRVEVVFRETTQVPPLATAMVQIERNFDNLKQIERAGWTTPAAHPDLTPAHEALLLREHFTELLRTDEVQARSKQFRDLLESTRAEAQSLETELRRVGSRPRTEVVRSRLSASLCSIASDCKRCHRSHRDLPAAER